MKIKFDANKYVEGYVESPFDMDGAIEFFGEVPEDFSAETCRFYKLVDDELVLDSDKQTAHINKLVLNGELSDLYTWFDWYDNQVAQYNRALRLGEPFDKDINILDAEAAQKQVRIRAIRESEE